MHTALELPLPPATRELHPRITLLAMCRMNISCQMPGSSNVCVLCSSVSHRSVS